MPIIYKFSISILYALYDESYTLDYKAEHQDGK